MKFIALIIFLFSASVFACGEKASEAFAPFAILLEKNPSFAELLEASTGKDMNTYELHFPIKDAKERDLFLLSIRTSVHNLFDLNVDYFERKEYEGDFYTAYLKLNKSLEGKTNIEANYSGGNKEGTSIYLCGNFKEFELTELLKVKPPNKRKRQ